MVGIILAGGRATRLGELTKIISKQMLPVYKQPMIYYPLKTLIDLGIKDILIIVSSELQKNIFETQLGDGSRFGANLKFVVQESPNGLAEAFIIGESFIGTNDVAMILGDNVFLAGEPMPRVTNSIFTFEVKNPSAYGVVVLENGKIKKIVEKPVDFISSKAVIGLYMFSSDVVEKAKELKPSPRGELEIVDLIKLMDQEHGMSVNEFNGAWFDCGTPDDLLECSEFVRALDKRTNHDIMLRTYELF